MIFCQICRTGNPEYFTHCYSCGAPLQRLPTGENAANAETVMVFMDHANTKLAGRDKKVQLDYSQILQWVLRGRKLMSAHAFVAVDPNWPELNEIEKLSTANFRTHKRHGTPKGKNKDGIQQYKKDVDVLLAVEVMEAVSDQNNRPDVVVLITGDVDYVPLVEALQRRQIHVEVAAFRERHLSEELKSRCRAVHYLDDMFAPEVKQDNSQQPWFDQQSDNIFLETFYLQTQQQNMPAQQQSRFICSCHICGLPLDFTGFSPGTQVRCCRCQSPILVPTPYNDSPAASPAMASLFVVSP